MEKTKFDSYASNYTAVHRDSYRLAGEDPDYFALYKIKYLSSHLRKSNVRPEELLDFGCGIGSCLTHLVPTFPNSTIHGMDVSSASIEAAKKRAPSVRTAVIGDTLPLGDETIDVAMAAGVFHHIPPTERLKWMSEIRRVIRPGGRFYLFEHNPVNPVTRKMVRDCPFDDDAILLPRRESATLMRESGFSSVSVDYVMFFPHMLAKLRPFERFMTRIPIGAQYVACGVA